MITRGNVQREAAPIFVNRRVDEFLWGALYFTEELPKPSVTLSFVIVVVKSQAYRHGGFCGVQRGREPRCNRVLWRAVEGLGHRIGEPEAPP